jgi:hypothetical protein
VLFCIDIFWFTRLLGNSNQIKSDKNKLSHQQNFREQKLEDGKIFFEKQLSQKRTKVLDIEDSNYCTIQQDF